MIQNILPKIFWQKCIKKSKITDKKWGKKMQKIEKHISLDALRESNNLVNKVNRINIRNKTNLLPKR